MKTHITAILIALLLPACSTTQIAAVRTVTDPLVVAAVDGYAQQYGVPPALTNAMVTPIQNDIWGIYSQVAAGQPAAQGAASAQVGAAVAKALPSGQQAQLAALQKAAGVLGGKK